MTPFAAAAALVLLSGCFLPRRGRTTQINSTSSDYSPVVTLSARISIADSVRIEVDRIRVVAPGEVFEGSTASTGAIAMQALLVSANTDASAAATFDRNGTSKPWREVSASQSVVIADSLFMGVPQTRGPLRFVLAAPAGFNRAASWLVFRITGPAKAMAARMADGTAPPEFKLPDIRVFACATQNLNGKTDKARAKVMAESYSSAC
jgi:hypothetical protein